MDTVITWVAWCFNIYTLFVLIHILLSWFQLPYNPVLATIRGFLYDTVEPYLRLFRGILPSAGGMDFSPIIALIVLQVVGRIVVSVLNGVFT